MSTEENKMITRRLLEEAISTGNLNLFDEFCAPSYQHNYFSSLAELKQAIMEIQSAFPDVRQTIEEMIAEDDKVVARATWRGTHTGEYQGIAPTGKVLTCHTVVFYRFIDGKVVDDRLISEGPDIGQLLLDEE